MANTRITQGVIKPNEDYDVRHINATGIITAQNISIGGTLTYNDVTNVDSIGIITARKGIVSSGVITATAFHGDGSNLTGVDSTSLKDPAGNIKIQAQASGAMHTGFSTMQNLRVTGIATFGSGSTTIDNNVINVGTALTLGHTQGLQFHTQNLHSAGFEINQINASGIITASSLDIGGNVSIGGTLTYEDVTNIDSVGIVTAAAGDFDDFVSVGSNIHLGNAGVVTATTFSGSGASLTNLPAAQLSGTAAAINGSNITNLNASNIASGTVPTARLGSGTANNTTFLRGDSTFQTVVTDLVNDTSPQLGGDLDANNKQILMVDSTGSNNRIKLGASEDLQLYHNANNNMSYIGNKTNTTLVIENVGETNIVDDTGGKRIRTVKDGLVELYHDNGLRLSTYSGGVKVSSDGSIGRLVLADTGGNFCWQLAGYDAASAGSGGRGVFQDANGAVVLDMRASGGNIFSYNTLKMNGNATVDNLKLVFGAGSDFEIFHDGTTNRFQSNGLKNFQFNPKDTDVGLKIIGDGGVELYYDGGKTAETVSGGFTVSGNLTATGFVDSSSDIKLKTNIKTIDNALDKVLQLRGAEYDRIDRDNQHEIGVIAQEVEKVIPEVVHGDETKTVSYGNIAAVLIEAIKEQNVVINKMKKEIEDLKG